MSKIRFMSKKLLAITLLVAITLTSANYYPYADDIGVSENPEQITNELEYGNSDNSMVRIYKLNGQDITDDSIYYVDANGELSSDSGVSITSVVECQDADIIASASEPISVNEDSSVDGEATGADADGEATVDGEATGADAECEATVDGEATGADADGEATVDGEATGVDADVNNDNNEDDLGELDSDADANNTDKYIETIVTDANGTPLSQHVFAMSFEGVIEAYYDNITVTAERDIVNADGVVLCNVDITAEAGDAAPGVTAEGDAVTEAGDATPGVTAEGDAVTGAGDAAPGVTAEGDAVTEVGDTAPGAVSEDGASEELESQSADVADSDDADTTDSGNADAVDSEDAEPAGIDPEEVEMTASEEAEAPKANASIGWKTVGSNKRYYYSSTKYYISRIATISNKKYGFDSNGYLIKNRVFSLNGIKYVALKDGAILLGVGEIDNKYYITDSTTGAIITKSGFYTVDGAKYYVKSNGVLARNLQFEVSKSTYFAGADCKLRTGVFYYKKAYYYVNPETYKLATKEGFVKWKGKKYYIYSSGKVAVSKFIKKSGKRYYASKSGYIIVGAFSLKGTYYFADKDGVLRTKGGWITWNNKKYYAKSNGTLYKNTLKEIGDHTYYFGNKAYAQSGVFETEKDGWRYADPKTYYVRMSNGFFTYGSQKYCSYSNGKLYHYTKFMYNGNYYIAGIKCYIMKGVFSYRGVYYYGDSRGVLKTSAGFITVGSNRYYCRAGGKIFKNGLFEVSGKSYIANSKGVILKGKFIWDDLTYYSDSYGVLTSKAGFYTISGQKYFVGEDGVVAISTSFKYQNVYYKADANGKCTIVSVTGDKIIAIAAKEVGATSGKKYWDEQFGGSPAYRNGDATPWCGCFVAWCFKKAGAYGAIKNISNLAYVPSYSAYADSKKLWVKTPKAGDLIIYSGSCHIGIVEKCVGSTVYTIEGNAGSGVCKRKSMPKSASYIKGYIRVL